MTKLNKNQIVTVLIGTVTKVIVTSFSKNNSTTNKMFLGQLFAILAMFLSEGQNMPQQKPSVGAKSWPTEQAIPSRLDTNTDYTRFDAC